MSKIQNDKYYTPPDLAQYCVEKTKEVIGADNITEYIEPSAGAGVFLDYLDKPYLAYDIEPEDDRIEKADWLSVDLDYKKEDALLVILRLGIEIHYLFSFTKNQLNYVIT